MDENFKLFLNEGPHIKMKKKTLRCVCTHTTQTTEVAEQHHNTKISTM